MNRNITNNNMKSLTLVITLALTIMACGEKKHQRETKTTTVKENTVAMAEASFSDEMSGKIFNNYQQIRMALVNSDASEAKAASGNLVESFSEDDQEMKSLAMAMADTEDLKKQRELFSELTAEVEPVLKSALLEGTIYKQFCPMAFDGKGGYWISNVDEIRNPYYGNKMLKCGKVVETIEK